MSATPLHNMEFNIGLRDFNAICRLCLKRPIEDGVRLSSIFPLPHEIVVDQLAMMDTIDLHKMMSICLGLDVNRNDNLPQTICSDCGRLLSSLYKFRVRSHFSDEYLRKLLGQPLPPPLQPMPPMAKVEPHRQISDFHSRTAGKAMNEIYLPEAPAVTDEDGDGDDYAAPASMHFGSDSEASDNEQPDKATFEDKKPLPLQIQMRRGGRRTKRDRNNVPKEQCPECGIFVKALNQHMVTHATVKPFECEICKLTFTRVASLKQHIQYVHMDIRNEHCPECDKAFHTRKALKSHMRTHTAVPMSFKCDICRVSCATEKSLQRHRLIHFTGTIYECETCQQRFACKEKLKKHERGHTSEFPYKCPDCDMIGFATNSKLQVHRRTHTGGKPYKCSKCTECFRYRDELAEHLKELHDISIDPRKPIFEQMIQEHHEDGGDGGGDDPNNSSSGIVNINNPKTSEDADLVDIKPDLYAHS